MSRKILKNQAKKRDSKLPQWETGMSKVLRDVDMLKLCDNDGLFLMQIQASLGYCSKNSDRSNTEQS